jgi:bifunctional enzyme CysN/CysC
VLVSFISPFRAERRMARELMGEGEFVEVFVDTPLEVCGSAIRRASTPRPSRRDQELHRHRFALRISGKPGNPSETSGKTPEEMVEQIESWLRERDLAEQPTTAAASDDGKMLDLFRTAGDRAGRRSWRSSTAT